MATFSDGRTITAAQRARFVRNARNMGYGGDDNLGRISAFFDSVANGTNAGTFTARQRSTAANNANALGGSQ